jgi:hypothetical protein
MLQIREARQQYVDGLANGGTLRGGDGTAEETAKMVGVIYGIDLLLDVRPPDEEEESEDADR